MIGKKGSSGSRLFSAYGDTNLYGRQFADSSGQGDCNMVPVDPRLRVVAKFISTRS
jgi:hypothetical protein